MKIIVTGITGFIGEHLGEYLKQKYELIGITRKLHDSDVKEDILYKESDYSVQSLKDIFQGADAIINLASQKAGNQEQEGIQGYVSSIALLENVIMAANDCNIKNIVNISSRCVYGTYTDSSFKETEEIHPINKYGVMKAWGETLSEYYNRTAGMKIKNLRLSQVVGFPMKDKYMFSTFLEKTRENETLDIFGQGTGKRDYIYIKDVCTAIERAVTHSDQCGIYNIGSGVAVSNKEVAEMMIDIFESDSKINIKEDSPKDTSRIVLNVEKAEKELEFTCAYGMSDILYDIKEQIKRS